MNQRKLRIDWCCTAMLMAALAGCAAEGDGPDVSLASVDGTVTLDNAPVQGVAVKFIPRGATGGQGSYAVTDAAGKYSCQHPSGKPGCEAGEYVVLFSRMTTRDGKPIPEGVNAADVEAKESLHSRYQNPESSLNLVTVTAEPNHFDFALKMK